MKTHIWNLLILGAAIALPAGAAPADETIMKSDTVQAGNGSLSSQQFVSDAVWSGDKEIALSKLAQQKSQNPEVKSFAARMIADHSRTADKITAIADREHLSYPSRNSFSFVAGGTTMETTPTGATATGRPNLPGTADLDSPKGLPAKAMMETPWASRTNADIVVTRNLNSLSGADFDRSYAEQMVKDHEAAVQEFETASANLDDPQLKQCATDALPTLRDHYRMAQDLQAKVGGGSATPNSYPGSPRPRTGY